MARHNYISLLGFVTLVQINEIGSGEKYVIANITVARGARNVGDHKQHMKLDSPTIMSRDPAVVEEMSTWKVNDVVEIKGMLAARAIGKGSFCKSCGAKNVAEGALVYVNPIFAKKRDSIEDNDERITFLSENREISNVAFVLGTLCRDPSHIKPKEGLLVTQYQIALNRKYRIKSDPPQVKTDYPWVKSYGENAVNDKAHLHVGSHVFIDGCLQARKVQRHKVCDSCGETYEWVDKALEIVPFETEYLANFYSDEEVIAREKADRERAVNNILSSLNGYGQ